MRQGALDGCPGQACLDGKAEFGVELACGDEVVRIRLDTRRAADEYALPTALGDDTRQQLELVIAVDDDGAAGAMGIVELVGSLVVAEQVDPLGRKPRRQRGVQLATRDHVQAEAGRLYQTQE